MGHQEFFSKIDFNKSWDEEDWEKFFQAQDAYRLSRQTAEISKKPMSRIKFVDADEVTAFDPVIRAYGAMAFPMVFQELRSTPFSGDTNPETDYYPTSQENPHYWGEGAPLASVLIYRDCCRFAISTAQEVERYLKRRDALYRRKFGAEFETLRFHANWIAINIAQGHRIGYSDERIRGNIAKARRALAHAETCLGLLGRVSRRTKSARLRKELFSFAVQLRNGLFEWIDELRSRIG